MQIMKRIGLEQNRILGGAVVLAVMQFGASFMGLIRDRVLASTFPELNVVDVYIAAFRPSDLLFQVMIMAGFSVALVPLLAKYKAQDNKNQMTELLSGVVTIAAIAFGLVALVGALLMPKIAPLLTQFDDQSLELYIQFARIALLTNFLFVFGNAYGQYLITIQRYWIYGLTPMLYTLGTILGTIYLTPTVGAFGPIYGTLGGAIIYVVLRIIAITVWGYKPRFKLWHPDLKEMGVLMLPRMIALGALQLELLLFDRVASGLATGSVTINAYARNFQAVAVGIVGIALAQSAYSLLSQAAAKKEFHRFYIYLRKGITILLILTIPGAIALAFLAPVAAWLVNVTHVLPVFALCLGIYAISIPFESINQLLLRSFYALKHTVTPAVFSVVNGGVAIAVAWTLAPRLGVFSLALGFMIGQAVQLLGLSIMLPRRVKKMASEP
ncbi:MAG: lipid II flippase MurJ [Candidatus Peribacteraceae bacterium]|nr:lipid II flippase MurJ [Candidatus Peribacteraceae bacterium]